MGKTVLVKAQIGEGKCEPVIGFNEMPLVFVVESNQLVHGMEVQHPALFTQFQKIG